MNALQKLHLMSHAQDVARLVLFVVVILGGIAVNIAAAVLTGLIVGWLA